MQSAHMLQEGSGEQRRPGDQEDGPRAAIDPAEIARLKGANKLPSPKLTASHHISDPSQTPSTRIAARSSVASSPLSPMAEKMPRKTRIVIGLVSVSAKVDR